jgi:oligopeptide transport system ATP-binding protein
MTTQAQAAPVTSADRGTALLEVRHLVKHFPIKAGLLIDRTVERVHAVDDVTFQLQRGETLGLVGESGCGKSTLCRTVLRLEQPTSGEIVFEQHDITSVSRRALRPLRRSMQMIFQDPYASLNPRKRVGQIVGDPMRLHGVHSGPDLRRAVQGLLQRVGLSPEHYNRFPHEFSGGQRQRIGIARAIALQPRLIVADEPVSALDVSIQAQIINLLKDLQQDFELTYVFVAHDLGVVRHVSDRIAVMYLGKVVEVSPAEDLYTSPHHPYTVALLSAIPLPDPRENAAREPLVLEGDVPSPIDPPPACRFHTRCPRATEICRRIEPPLVDYGDGHLAACHHPVNVEPAELARVRIAPESPLTAGDEKPTLDPALPDLAERVDMSDTRRRHEP